MDFDLEIISEENDCPDPLFDSIMSAMNSMKEATADKIYQKIQKEGETNYSKPQVDRALANALKYGIFEVRNNRYRVRDDILDDEDTVYWKFQKKEQTPFRIQDDINERHYGLRLDPERDNQRFRKLENPESLIQECPKCGKIKRPEEEKPKFESEELKAAKKKKKPLKSGLSKTGLSKSEEREAAKSLKRKREGKSRKKRSDSKGRRKVKKRRPNEKDSQTLELQEYLQEESEPDYSKETQPETQEEAYDSSDVELDFLSPLSDKISRESSLEGRKNHDDNHKSRSTLSQENDDGVPFTEAKKSNDSLKFDSENVRADLSSFSDDQSRTEDAFFESLPCTSRNSSGKNRNVYLGSNDMYNNPSGRNRRNQCEGKPDWLGCTDEPQGTVIVSRNVLTIEPMDSLAFKSPEQASYIS